jgi:hypothetical protein
MRGATPNQVLPAQPLPPKRFNIKTHMLSLPRMPTYLLQNQAGPTPTYRFFSRTHLWARTERIRFWRECQRQQEDDEQQLKRASWPVLDNPTYIGLRHRLGVGDWRRTKSHLCGAGLNYETASTQHNSASRKRLDSTTHRATL